MFKDSPVLDAIEHHYEETLGLDHHGEEERLTESLPPRPSRAEAEAAVRTLIRWVGDNPEREGLLETPARVARAYEDFFRGYTNV